LKSAPIVSRRRLLTGAAASAAFLAAPTHFLRAEARARVVVVGGGAGGATAARYLAKEGGDRVEVVLVEPKEEFATCFHSNLYLGGAKEFDGITHRYDRLVEGYGIRHVRDMAEAVDRAARQVRLDDGETVDYDHLVLSPGIDLLYDRIEGYSEEAAEIMPHAWQAGPQTRLLRDKLMALEDGALIVMLIPANPFRCPPGPYERACMMAYALKRQGHTTSRIILVDEKDAFSKQALFQQAWERHYPGMIEWQDPLVHGGIGAVDPATMTVETDLETYEADLVNVIPPQAAGRIARDAGLADDSGFCPILADSMRSAADEHITVLGDAAIAGDMPKSGFSANSQAKVAVNAILADLFGTPAFLARYANTCWSMLADDDGVNVGGVYEPQDGRITATATFVSQPDEDAETRRRTQEENHGWYAAITRDMFG
jgi:sulfide dehydrogenase [flavocytochrome c] flavoprotein subunit